MYRQHGVEYLMGSNLTKVSYFLENSLILNSAGTIFHTCNDSFCCISFGHRCIGAYERTASYGESAPNWIGDSE
jgi:hypothetical protein